MGPYIPIYGAGALLVYLTLYPFRDQMALVYLGGVIFPSALEFMTSWVMEKLFAARWWDYSHRNLIFRDGYVWAFLCFGAFFL